MKKIFLTAVVLAALVWSAAAQTEPVVFAYLSDVHLSEGSPRIGNLEKCIEDINANDEVQFVILAGDITEFGADSEIELAKNLLDKLNKPYYIVAGNHDAKWSESGCNTFAKVFGYEQFDFEAGGIRFLGCNSGPNMRMAPALLPHECLVWLDSVASTAPKDQKIICVNHFPQDTSVLNYPQFVNTLKKCNIQLVLGGHWHSDVILDYGGIPGILGRSPDRGKELGYNIMTIADGKFSARNRIIGNKDGKVVSELRDPWFTMELSDAPRFTPMEVTEENPYCIPDDFPWMGFDINDKYPQVQTVWRVQDESDIGAGSVKVRRKVLYTNTQGAVKALRAKDGSLKWKFMTDGKVFSTPAVSGRRVVVGSTDGNIYCLSLRNGKLLWKYKCEKSVLAAPAVFEGVAYVGSSDHIFRAIDIRTGKLVWQYEGVKGFVECRPYVDRTQVVFGDWANTLYSLDTQTGALQWKWGTKGSRMFSPAATYPVKHDGKIYICTPERKTYAIDAATGETVWEAAGGRESVALTEDGTKVISKVMFGSVQAFSSTGNECKKLWQVAPERLGYEIGPTPCASTVADGREVVFVPTDKGNIYCLDAADGSTLWIHKISMALLNSIQPLPGRKLLISTMDGVVTILKY